MTLEIKTDSSSYRMFDMVHGSLYYGIDDYQLLNGETVVVSDSIMVGGNTGIGSSTEIPVVIGNDNPTIVPVDVSLWAYLRDSPSIATYNEKEGVRCSVNTIFGNKTSLTDLPLNCSHDWILE